MALKYQKQHLKEPPRYLDDCQRIQKILLAKGYEVSLHECEDMWESHSESYCAGWLILPDDDNEILESLTD